MIHKRFNHTRHLIWAAFLLTLFISSAASHKSKEATAVQQEMAIAKAATTNTVAAK